MTLITIAELEHQILQQESVMVKVIESPRSKSYVTPKQVPSYVEKYPTRISGEQKLSVLVKRISALIPGVSFRVLYGDGRLVASRLSKMETIRTTYSAHRNAQSVN